MDFFVSRADLEGGILLAILILCDSLNSFLFKMATKHVANTECFYTTF